MLTTIAIGVDAKFLHLTWPFSFLEKKTCFIIIFIISEK